MILGLFLCSTHTYLCVQQRHMSVFNTHICLCSTHICLCSTHTYVCVQHTHMSVFNTHNLSLCHRDSCLCVPHRDSCLCVAHTHSCAGGRAPGAGLSCQLHTHWCPLPPTQDCYPALRGRSRLPAGSLQGPGPGEVVPRTAPIPREALGAP